MFTTIGFLESVDPGGAYNALTGLADQHVTVQGNDILIPQWNRVVAVAAGVETAAAHRARLTAPSLRSLAALQITPLNGQAAAAVEPDSPQKVLNLLTTPVELVRGEKLNAEVLSDPVAAQVQWCIVWLADADITPVTGRVFTVRATGGSALTANQWSLSALTFEEDLPVGRYQIVGFRPMSDGMVAARLVTPQASHRPGALGVDSQEDIQWEHFRYGRMGVWGEFEDTSPPQVEALSVSADAAANQQYWLDLIQVRLGPAA